MTTIIRKHYQGQINTPRGNFSADSLAAAQEQVAQAIANEQLETFGLYQDENQVFIYLEAIVADDSQPLANELAPDTLLPELSADLTASWQEMHHEYCFAYPESLADWRRDQSPEARLGRLAHLYPEKRQSYLDHHRNIVSEGIMQGDKYQSIANLGNVLFSYFETPRDRYVTNVKRTNLEESQALADWIAVDPESHFVHGEKNPVENFYIIETLFALGHEA